MSVESKGTKSFRKKDLPGQLAGALGLSKIVFAHKASLGDTGFSLLSLTIPSELTANGFSQPGVQVLASASLLRFKNNFSLISSLTGLLIPYQAYTIGSASQVNFVGFTAADGEIFYGIIDTVAAQSGLNVVSANPLVVTGVLAQGLTDFNVGTPFSTNQFPTTQMGSVAVYRKGILQVRNTNNATASLTADGNYQELPAAGPTGNVIRFNIPPVSLQGDPIVVISNGLLVNNPTDSMMALVESVQGQISAMVPVLADAAGVTQASLGGIPSSVDLRSFGNLVQGLANGPANTLKGNNTGVVGPTLDLSVAAILAMIGFGASAMTAPGYITLPGGLIIQWISTTASSGGVVTNWPIPFPNQIFAAVASPSNQLIAVQVNGTTVHVTATVASGTPSISVIAIGN